MGNVRTRQDDVERRKPVTASRRIAATHPRRELANVTVALQHAMARERAINADGRFDPGALVAQVRVAMLRARAAQLRRLVAGDRRAPYSRAVPGVLPFPSAPIRESVR